MKATVDDTEVKKAILAMQFKPVGPSDVSRPTGFRLVMTEGLFRKNVLYVPARLVCGSGMSDGTQRRRCGGGQRWQGFGSMRKPSVNKKKGRSSPHCCNRVTVLAGPG